jgi:hypothetical protein
MRGACFAGFRCDPDKPNQQPRWVRVTVLQRSNHPSDRKASRVWLAGSHAHVIPAPTRKQNTPLRQLLKGVPTMHAARHTHLQAWTNDTRATHEHTRGAQAHPHLQAGDDNKAAGCSDCSGEQHAHTACGRGVGGTTHRHHSQLRTAARQHTTHTTPPRLARARPTQRGCRWLLLRNKSSATTAAVAATLLLHLLHALKRLARFTHATTTQTKTKPWEEVMAAQTKHTLQPTGPYCCWPPRRP